MSCYLPTEKGVNSKYTKHHLCFLCLILKISVLQAIWTTFVPCSCFHLVYIWQICDRAGSRLDVSQILLFRLNVYCHVGRLYTVALLCNISLETHQFKEKVICCLNSFPVLSPPPETRPIGGEKPGKEN